jgi:transcriptional/translational regulatory protein YebC/TACO1
MDVALDAGADDIVDNDDGSIEVLTAPNDFVAVREALTKAGLRPDFADVTMKPSSEVVLAGDDAARMQKLLDDLESLDDVQEVYTNAVMDGDRG